MPLIPLERTILRLSGPDARDFLNNLLTNDLDRLPAGEALYAGLLTPQGKVFADMFVWDAGRDGLLIETDPARGPALLQKLSMFKLRAKVEIDTDETLGAAVDLSGASGQPDPRRPDGALGARLILPRAEISAAPDPAALLARRLAVGAPDLAQDAALEEVFALEALFEELHGVDFHKGCFVGQENVSRMKRRATTRRKFCPIVFEGPAPAPMTPVTAGAAELGTVRSGMDGRALALVRLDRAAEARAKGQALRAGDHPIRLDPPPWLLAPPAQAPAPDDAGGGTV